jgi:hypothetical protein
MIFNGTINVIGVGVESPTDTELDVILTLGQVFALPNVQPAIIPFSRVRFSLDKDTANKLSQSLKEGADKLKPPSKLDVASTMSDVEQAAKSLDSFGKPMSGG